MAIKHDDPQLGSPSVASASKEAEEVADPPPETEGAESSRGGEKRKRGRPSTRLHFKTPAKKHEEEDVCFICFDGGNLVLCDRRGCTKAYHPTCVNLDEAIFKGKTPWNCGWHTCSICEKASQYMCYTCTYSLCKGCIKEAGLLCVRGNKGFCETCMKTVMQIEKGVQANKEMAKVDFSDTNSWEYLFKIYWLDLKGKLSLTLEELTKARNPSNGKAFDEGPSHEPCDATDDRGSSSDSSSGLVEGSSSKGKKVKRSSSFTAKGGLRSAEKAGGEGKSVLEDVEWASKELLEFVAHMKDGDTSALSQSDVKALVLKYIKRNNLRDPRKKTQIICDSRLGNLFGKERVGQLEMLKLLEPHFLLKNKTMGGSSNADGIQMEMEGDNDALTNTGSDKRRKSRKRVDERGRLQTNLDDFAAIDVHNINLIYLRRKVLEDMLVDMDKFQEKVVGSFVRIRISGTAQNQDLYRLVQVVGVGKSEVAYKTGRTTEDVTLEILNLNSTEVVSIDTVSNQEFTEEECKQLRQSIKCGHISPLKVGEVQEKARAIQKVRVKDWIESEMSRLSNLRDRASEKGRRKELNECLKKLQLLSTPEQRSRLLEEPPEVHDDPSMDPSYASDEDEGDRYDNRRRPRDAGFSRKGKEPISPGEGGLASNDDWKTDINMSTKDDTAGAGESTKESSLNPGSSSWGTATGLESGGWKSQLASGSGVSLDATQEIVPVPISSPPIPDISDTDKIWYYQDPSGKNQGPFSMAQLHKWSKIGYFPSSLRTWKTSETQEDSILLTDAINGMFPKEPSQWETHVNGFPDHGGTTLDDGKENKQEGGWSGSTSSAWRDKPKNNGDSESNWNNTSGPTNGNAEESKTDPWGTQASAWTSRASEVASSKEEWTGSSSQAWDSSKSHNSGLTPPVNSDILPSGQNAGNSWNTTRKTGFESSNQDFGKPNISKAWETPSSAVAPESTTDVWSVKEGSGNDSSNVPTAPEQGSGWTVGQSAGNKWSAASVQPTGSGWGAISNSGSDGAQQSLHVATNSDKIAPGWGTKVSTSEKPTAGGWDDSNRSRASTHNPTVTLDSGKNDLFIKPAPTPNPGSDGWAGRQGDEDKLAGSPAISALAGSDNCGNAPNPGSSWGKQSTASVSEIKKAASMDERNSTPVKSSVEFWGSDALAPSFTASDTTDILEPIANLVGQSTTKGSNWSTPSTCPATMSSGWGNSVSNAVKDSSQNKLATPSDNWKSGSPAKLSETGSAIKPSVSPNTGWGTGATAENPDPILGTTPKNSNDGWGASQVMGTGTAPEGNANASWGKATQGNENAGCGASPQGKSDMSWGKAAVQGNADSCWGASQVKSANMGSGAAPEGNTNASWGIATQGNEDAGWGASPQGKANMSWGKAAVQANADSGWGAPQESTKVGWGGPKGSANTGWGTASQGNTNVGSGGPQGSADSGWGTGSQGNTNSGWGASSGNSWGGQQKNTGERFSGDSDRGFHSSDSGQGRGKPSWNRSMSTGDGGSSRPPPRGQRVCKFHESGHCKKGSSCNFLHP
ncbi:hypothetical protein MRB53_018921 [Persea americana]|uniref:Uncharacterized protein n=1 Tax=Persea americana TaxID=3435 RepID=A0ACC2MAQ0_PERAE|nr:hypothetical protein MRB53_018921 [Persea americana]